MCVVSTVYSGLAVDVRRHVLYFSDEGQGHVGQLQLKPTTENHFAAEIIDSTAASRPRSVVVDSVNRCCPPTMQQVHDTLVT